MDSTQWSSFYTVQLCSSSTDGEALLPQQEQHIQYDDIDNQTFTEQYVYFLDALVDDPSKTNEVESTNGIEHNLITFEETVFTQSTADMSVVYEQTAMLNEHNNNAPSDNSDIDNLASHIAEEFSNESTLMPIPDQYLNDLATYLNINLPSLDPVIETQISPIEPTNPRDTILVNNLTSRTAASSSKSPSNDLNAMLLVPQNECAEHSTGDIEIVAKSANDTNQQLESLISTKVIKTSSIEHEETNRADNHVQRRGNNGDTEDPEDTTSMLSDDQGESNNGDTEDPEDTTSMLSDDQGESNNGDTEDAEDRTLMLSDESEEQINASKSLNTNHQQHSSMTITAPVIRTGNIDMVNIDMLAFTTYFQNQFSGSAKCPGNSCSFYTKSEQYSKQLLNVNVEVLHDNTHVMATAFFRPSVGLIELHGSFANIPNNSELIEYLMTRVFSTQIDLTTKNQGASDDPEKTFPLSQLPLPVCVTNTVCIIYRGQCPLVAKLIINKCSLNYLFTNENMLILSALNTHTYTTTAENDMVSGPFTVYITTTELASCPPEITIHHLSHHRIDRFIRYSGNIISKITILDALNMTNLWQYINIHRDTTLLLPSTSSEWHPICKFLYANILGHVAFHGRTIICHETLPSRYMNAICAKSIFYDSQFFSLDDKTMSYLTVINKNVGFMPHW